MEQGLQCWRVRPTLTCMDSEAPQLKWQRSDLCQLPTLPDIMHVVKSLRNSIVNNFILIHGVLVNTRMLLTLIDQGVLDLPPSACLPSDRMSHAALQSLLEAEPSIPSQRVCLQLHPDNVAFSSTSTITSELSRVCRITSSMGRDVLLDRGRQCFCVYQRARSGAVMTFHIPAPLDCCTTHKANEVLLLAKNGVKQLNVRSGQLQDIAVDNRGAVRPTMISLAFASGHGFATDGRHVCRCELQDTRLLLQPAICAMTAPITDLACEHECCCYISTKNYVVVLSDSGINSVPSPTGALGLTISSGLVSVHRHGVYRLLPFYEEIKAMSLPESTCVTSIGESIIFAADDRAYLISNTAPLKTFLRICRKAMDACGLQDRRSMASMTKDITSTVNELQRMYKAQDHFAYGLSSRRNLQGPCSFFSNVLRQQLEILAKNLPLVPISDAFLAKAAQEVVVENVFGMMTRQRTTAFTHEEFASAYPKVAQQLMLRTIAGKPLMNDVPATIYPCVALGQRDVLPNILNIHRKHSLPDRSKSRTVMSKIRKAIKVHQRTGRVRAMSMAPLGTKLPLCYVTLKQVVPDDTPTESYTMVHENNTGVMFEAHAFVAVLGERKQVWLARVNQDVFPGTKSVDLTWLEQSTRGWEWGMNQAVSTSCLIAAVTEYVTLPSLTVDDACWVFVEERLQELDQERHRQHKQQTCDNPYRRVAYRTTGQQRRLRRQRQTTESDNTSTDKPN